MLSFLKNKKGTPANPNELKAFLSGKVISIEEVKDSVFSSRMLGDGLAIEPASELILSPCDGVISVVMEDSGHAVGITAANGMELLIHEGLDTVALNGEGFELYVKPGDKVKAGDKLIKFDAALIKSKGYDASCILVITNADEYPNRKLYTGIESVAGETVIIEAE